MKPSSIQPARLGSSLGATLDFVLGHAILVIFGVGIFVATVLNIKAAWPFGALHTSPITHFMPEGDFSNLWSAGHLARTGRVGWIYSSPLFQAWKQSQFGGILQPNDFIYPPTALLLGIPFSFLPLGAAYGLWLAGTFVVALLLLRWARLPWPVAIAGLVSPASCMCFMFGQYGVIIGGLVVSGLLFAPRYPRRAGILLALSTIKPQQGLITPVAWLAGRYGKAIIVAAALFALMSATVVFWFGGHAWLLFFSQAGANARRLLDAPPSQPYIRFGVSIFWMCRMMGWGIGSSYAAQAAGALAAMFFTYRAWRIEQADPLARMAVTVCLSLMIAPYGFVWDMVAYSIGVAAVGYLHGRLRLIDVLLWLWPGYCNVIAMGSGILFTPLVVLAATAVAWHRMTHPPERHIP